MVFLVVAAGGYVAVVAVIFAVMAVVIAAADAAVASAVANAIVVVGFVVAAVVVVAAAVAIVAVVDGVYFFDHVVSLGRASPGWGSCPSLSRPGTQVGTDIQDNKCSWLVVQALQRATKEQKEVLVQNYAIDEEAKVSLILFFCIVRFVIVLCVFVVLF